MKTGLSKLFGIGIGVAIAACVVQSQPPANGPTAPYPNQGGGEPPPAGGDKVIPDGQYSCTIDDYSPFVCQVYTNPDGSQTLEKMGGSQRFRGKVFEADNGFAFEGVFFCPYGDCTRDVQANFDALDDGLFRGTLQSDGGRPIRVALQYMPGGMGYGGVGYGAMYGGAGYGYGAGRRF